MESMDEQTLMNEIAETANRAQTNYEFGELIGGGRFSHVFLGTNRETGKPCALKVQRSHGLREKQEMRIMNRLPKHPNIVQMEDSFLFDSSLVLVLELAQTDLRSFLKKEGGRVSENDAKCLMKGLSLSLEALSQKKIFHRDLKPENIFVNVLESGGDGNRSFQVKLGDFGLATFAQPTQTFRGVIGTPFYTAPEIWAQRVGYTTKADLYSCGAILFELMSGKPPFSFVSSQEELIRCTCGLGDDSPTIEELIEGVCDGNERYCNGEY